MALSCQPFDNLDQGDVALRIDPAQDRGSMGFGTITVPVATNRIRLNTPRALVALEPAHRRGDRNIKLHRRSPPRKPALNRLPVAIKAILCERILL